MTYKIEQVEGIGNIFSQRLGEVGISTTEDLLRRCSTADLVREVAGRTGISEHMLLGWANQADLMRVSGIGSEFGQLLEASGIESVDALSQREPDNLVNLLTRVNAEKRLTRVVPPLRTVQKWVQRAQTLSAPAESHAMAAPAADASRAKLTQTIAHEVPSTPTPTRALLPS